MIEFWKLWWIALIDLVEDTGYYRRDANSYPPTYRGCHICTAHIFKFISAIYDWFFFKFWLFALIDLVDDTGGL